MIKHNFDQVQFDQVIVCKRKKERKKERKRLPLFVSKSLYLSLMQQSTFKSDSVFFFSFSFFFFFFFLLFHSSSFSDFPFVPKRFWFGTLVFVNYFSSKFICHFYLCLFVRKCFCFLIQRNIFVSFHMEH